MNKELLKKVAKTMLQNSNHIDMHSWVGMSGPNDDGDLCGTTGCIAGWTVAINRSEESPEKSLGRIFKNLWRQLHESPSRSLASDEAERLLWLTHDQALRLFHIDEWPRKFAKEYYAEGACSKAKACYNRIQHFIETEGLE